MKNKKIKTDAKKINLELETIFLTSYKNDFDEIKQKGSNTNTILLVGRTRKIPPNRKAKIMRYFFFELEPNNKEK